MVSDLEIRPQRSASTHINQLPSVINFTEQPLSDSNMGPELGRTQHQLLTSNNQQSPRPTISGSNMGSELGRTHHQLFVSNNQQSPRPTVSGSYIGSELGRIQQQLFTSNNQQSPQPTISGSYMGSELGKKQHQLFISNHQQSPIPGPHPRPVLHYVHGVQEAIQREIEKEQIRQEIIMSEIARRHELEAEVRRELMMEMELAGWRGRDGLPFAPPSHMGFGSSLRLPAVEPRGGRSLVEERIISSLSERDRLFGRRESVVEPLPFQRGSAEVRNSEVKPASDGAKEKEKIILLPPKPSENISGVKRVISAGEIPSETNSRKKLKEDWSCALCRVSTTSEQALNEHLQGKKHKKSEAKLKAQSSGKNYSIGLFPKKAAKPIPGTDKVAPPSTPINDKANIIISYQPLLEEQPNLGKSEQNKKPAAGQEMQIGSNHPKKKFKFPCDVCQIGCHSRKVLNAHLRGKKHRARVAMSQLCCRDEKNDAVEENNEEDGGAVDESVPEEQNPKALPKVENDAPVEDSNVEDCGAIVVNEPVDQAKDVDGPSSVEIEMTGKDVSGHVEEAAADDGRTAVVNEQDLKAGMGDEPKESEATIS